MFALYAAAEDLGPVSAVASGRLSALALLGAIVLRRGVRLPGRAVCARLAGTRRDRRGGLRHLRVSPRHAAR